MKKSATSAAKAKPAAKRKKVAADSHSLAKQLPEGAVLKDLMKGEWKVGKPIGSGGFGLLYLADRNSSAAVSTTAQYVVKVEPVGNGPLFCELHFYQRAAKPDAICDWKTSHKLKSLGVPQFIATGQHEHDGCQCRFLVMERFDTDLQKMFEKSGKRFPTTTVFLLGLQLLDVLEYIHDKEYVHADIKASNLLIGYTDPQQVYLVDYGLAYRYMADGVRKAYKEDKKRTHDGTIEFTSRDAHHGVCPAPRGDMEILGYCLVQWLCGRLPWEDNLNNKDYVRDQKVRFMADIPAFMKQCFPQTRNIPVAELSAYLSHVVSLQYTDRPDYQHCRQLFIQALKSVGGKLNDKLAFGPVPAASPAAKSPAKAGRKRSSSAASPAAKPRAKLVSSPEFPLFSDDDDGAATASPPKVRHGNAGKMKAGKAAAAKTAPPVRAGSAARSGSGTAVANGLPNPLAVARLPTPVSRSTPAKTVASSALKSPGLGQSTAAAGATSQRQLVRRRKNRVADVKSASTQTSPSLQQ